MGSLARHAVAITPLSSLEGVRRKLARFVSPRVIPGEVLQRKTGCACGGGCPRCHSEDIIQTKLKVSTPDDEHEREADRVADEIMRMPDPRGGAGQVADSITEATDPGAQRDVESSVEEMPADLESGPEEDETEKDEGLDFDIIGEDEAEGDPTPLDLDDDPELFALPKREGAQNPYDSVQIPKGGGEPLDPSVRDRMENRFGLSFANVRIHKDGDARGSASQLDARAYTIGSHIFFGGDYYQPETNSGQWLLAHELAHVIQQGHNANLQETLQRQPKKPSKGKPQPAKAPRHVLVILDEQQALAMEGENVVRKMGISSGKPGKETKDRPTEIGQKDEHHRSSEYGKCDGRPVTEGKASCRKGETYEGTPMPFFQRFGGSKEGFHQGPLPGHPASHGCVRLSPGDAKWLWDWTSKGTKVDIVKTRKKGNPPSKPPSKPSGTKKGKKSGNGNVS